MLSSLLSPFSSGLFLFPILHHQAFGYMTSRDFPSTVIFFHVNSSFKISNFLLGMMWGFSASGHVGRAGVSEAQKASHDQQSSESQGNVFWD